MGKKVKCECVLHSWRPSKLWSKEHLFPTLFSQATSHLQVSNDPREREREKYWTESRDSWFFFYITNDVISTGKQMDIQRIKRITAEIEGRQWEILLQSKKGQVTFDTLILLMLFIPDGASASVANSLSLSFKTRPSLFKLLTLKSFSEVRKVRKRFNFHTLPFHTFHTFGSDENVHKLLWTDLITTLMETGR